MLKRIASFSAAAVLVACATVTVDLPPISEAPSGQHDAGRVVWHDLLTNSPEASRATPPARKARSQSVTDSAAEKPCSATSAFAASPPLT